MSCNLWSYYYRSWSLAVLPYYTPPLIGGGIKRWCCLTSVWHLTSVAYIGPKWRTEWPRKTKIGTEVAHVTRLGHHFQSKKVKGQGHQAALLTAVLARQAAAVVSVGTYWPWETTATLRSARRREALRRPQGEERGGAYRGGRPPTACYCSWWWNDVNKYYIIVSR